MASPVPDEENDNDMTVGDIGCRCGDGCSCGDECTCSAGYRCCEECACGDKSKDVPSVEDVDSDNM